MALVGTPSNGKASLLRLLAKVISPSEGEVYVPPHLRIVHVEQQAQLLTHLSLYDNLTFGWRYERPRLQEVIVVCESLGLPAHLLGLLYARDNSDDSFHGERTQSRRVKTIRAARYAPVDDNANGALEEDGDWQNRLSGSEIRLVSLARAIITQPHLLVLHRPLTGLDEHLATKVLDVLRQFVDKRGVLAPDGRAEQREPRTVIFTCSTMDEFVFEAVDSTIVVGKNMTGSNIEIQTVARERLKRGIGKAVQALKHSAAGSLLTVKAQSEGSFVSRISRSSSSNQSMRDSMGEGSATFQGHPLPHWMEKSANGSPQDGAHRGSSPSMPSDGDHRTTSVSINPPGDETPGAAEAARTTGFFEALNGSAWSNGSKKPDRGLARMQTSTAIQQLL
uniref:ABC transporter domain-containing protein n=1 Tax=Haptolina ericina TaxID=156174 RepID=A0A7S3EX64_9EUKA